MHALALMQVLTPNTLSRRAPRLCGTHPDLTDLINAPLEIKDAHILAHIARTLATPGTAAELGMQQPWHAHTLILNRQATSEPAVPPTVPNAGFEPAGNALTGCMRHSRAPCERRTSTCCAAACSPNRPLTQCTSTRAEACSPGLRRTPLAQSCQRARLQTPGPSLAPRAGRGAR